MTKSCGACQFWQEGDDVDEKGLGRCHRYPPVSVGHYDLAGIEHMEERWVKFDWPVTADHEWCGECQAK